MHTVMRFQMDIGYFAYTNAALGLYNYYCSTFQCWAGCIDNLCGSSNEH